jgi:protocatechuate 3,4-dioxygenase beta subunit
MRFCSALSFFSRCRTLLPVALTGLLLAPGTAQSVYTGQPSPSLHVLTGTVVNSATGAPIPFALVQVEQNAKFTDQNGNFRFENLISASVSIQAHKPGFFEEQEISQMHRPTMVTLSDHQTNTVVPLIPEAVIVGHVADSEGEPLGNLPVRARYGQVMNGRRTWQQQGFRQTDEDGNFRIANLKPGIYYVEVGPQLARPFAMGEQLRANGKAEAIPAEYYPGVRDLSDATPLNITAGQKVNLDFGMKRVPAFHLSGMVTGATTNAGNLALLDRDGEENLNLGIRLDGRTGRFDAFPVPAGSYHLRFDGYGEGQHLFADAPISVNGDILELRLSAQRTLNIPIEVETEYTKQNPGQSQGSISNISSGPGRSSFPGQVHLFSRSGNRQPSGTRVGEDGLFITEVEPGTYDVEVDVNGTSYVASATCGGVNLLTDPLVVATGGDPQPIRIVLRDDGASLNGAVQIADASQSALVLMVPEGSSANPPRQMYVDSSGSFHAQGIAPGSYDILAFDRLDGLEYGNREVLNAYLSRAAHVTLSADEQARVTVDLIQTKQ